MLVRTANWFFVNSVSFSSGHFISCERTRPISIASHSICLFNARTYFPAASVFMSQNFWILHGESFLLSFHNVPESIIIQLFDWILFAQINHATSLQRVYWNRLGHLVTNFLPRDEKLGDNTRFHVSKFLDFIVENHCFCLSTMSPNRSSSNSWLDFLLSNTHPEIVWTTLQHLSTNSGFISRSWILNWNQTYFWHAHRSSGDPPAPLSPKRNNDLCMAALLVTSNSYPVRTRFVATEP